MNVLEKDQIRYGSTKMPKFQCYYRKAQMGGVLKLFYKFLFIRNREKKVH